MKKNHKITLLVIGILLALSLMLSSSYALWVFNVSQESTNVVQADCFELTLTDSNPIGLAASFPMRDGDGVQTTPYTFTIKNICNHPADFQINLETLNTSTIDESFIKADLNGHITEYNTAESVEPTIDDARSAVMLYEDTLAVNGEKTYILRLWVNENATQEDVENKSYTSKISVKATVRKQYAEGTLISGQNFNVALKTLADGGNPNYWTRNTTITSIEWSENAPQENDNAVNLAVEGTNTPIYVWFKDGTIYINSELNKIYMNIDSSYMFEHFDKVLSIDLSHFDTSKVTDMSYMFYYVRSITDLNISSFNTSNVTNMSYMFSLMIELNEIDVSTFDTSNVTDMSWMFYDMKGIIDLDLTGFNTSKVVNMKGMFSEMNNLVNLYINTFDTSNVTDMSSMFYWDWSLETLDVSHFDTSNVEIIDSMFNGLSKLAYLDVSNFDTSKVENLGYLFYAMHNLREIDVSNFDTSRVTNMNHMFAGATSLGNLDLSNFDTSNVTNMQGMFSGMENLKRLDITNFDTSKVTDMYCMFNGMLNLTSLDLSSFDTSNVTSMLEMFKDSTSFKTIYVGNKWDTSKVTRSDNILNNCPELVGGAGTTYDSNHTDIEYARVDDPASGKPGYFTLKTS